MTLIMPDVIGHFAHPHIVTCEDGAEIDLASAKAESTALTDGDCLIVQRIFQWRQS